MDRIAQRTKNDCLRCAVAMATNQPYEDVPNFVEVSPSSWSGALRDWLSNRGLGFVRIGIDLEEPPEGVPLIGIGKGRLACMHAVVFHAVVEIDPAPSALGLLGAPKHLLAILPLATE